MTHIEGGRHKTDHTRRTQTQTYAAGSTRYRYYFRSDNTLSMRPSTANKGVKNKGGYLAFLSPLESTHHLAHTHTHTAC